MERSVYRKDMKRIGLFLSSKEDSGGLFQYNQAMLEAVCALPDNEFEIRIAYSDKLWEAYLQDRTTGKLQFKKTFINRITAGIWEMLGLSMALWRKISPCFHPLAIQFLKTKCDLWIFPSAEPWTYRLPVSALGTVHDLMHRYEPRFPEVSSYSIYRQRERKYKYMCQWAKAILVDSELGKYQVHESYGRDLDSIMVLPFTPPKYIYAKQISRDFNKRHALPEKYIFYPAHLWYHKNHQELIKAAAQLKSIVPDLKLVLTGLRKNSYSATIQLINELGLADRVILLDYVLETDMPELYRRARAMIMPTFFGPTNIPPLEAFVTGCPAAVSNIYAMPEQVGDAALLFDPGSTEEIAKVMQRLWTDSELCSQLTAKGFEQVKRYSPERFKHRLYSILREVLGDL